MIYWFRKIYSNTYGESFGSRKKFLGIVTSTVILRLNNMFYYQ
jgi:hypothetical protein